MKKTYPVYKVLLPIIIISLLLFSAVFTINASAFSDPYHPDLFTGDPTSEPGPAELTLYHELDLSVKNSENWPPSEGDLLKYYFKIKNIGGADATLENYGVYGVCNGTEIWEAYADESVVLSSHEFRMFDGYFPTGLNQGHCEFTVRYQDGEGWHDIGDTISFTVQESQPGGLEFYYTLRFSVKDKDRWPPLAGDKIVGYFKIKNTGGQAIHLENLGITGTFNLTTELEVLKGAPLTLEPGQHFIFEKAFPDPMKVGNYEFVVIYKENGDWHMMGDDFEFTVSEKPETEPANLILYHAFSLTVKENEDRWPPQEGDILTAYFKIKNVGGKAATPSNLGVNGTRNGSEEWDLFINQSKTLNPGEYYIFSMSFTTPLTPGEYGFQPYYQDSGGWHAIGDYIGFTIQTTEVLEPTLTSELMIYAEGSGEWPPLSGDQLKAFYMLQNNTSQTLNFENLGVFGTRTTEGDWSLYHSEPVSIEPGAFWAFDKTFPDTLVPGDYQFVISYQDAAGWHTLGSYVEFTVTDTIVEEPVVLEPDVLYLNVVGGNHWPPYIDDFVGASFLLENNTDQDHTYDELGVYGTKDGNTQILLAHPDPVTILPGDSWTFNGEFPESFGAGNYLLTIYVVDGNGFQTIGGYEFFVVDTEAPPDILQGPSVTQTPEETPTPGEGELNGEYGSPDQCRESFTGWVECNILTPIKGFFCWIRQIFDPDVVCEG